MTCPAYQNQLQHLKNGKNTWYKLQIEQYMQKYGIDTPSTTAWPCFNTPDPPYNTQSTFTNTFSKIRCNIKGGIFTQRKPKKVTLINYPTTDQTNAKYELNGFIQTCTKTKRHNTSNKHSCLLYVLLMTRQYNKHKHIVTLIPKITHLD